MMYALLPIIMMDYDPQDCSLRRLSFLQHKYTIIVLVKAYLDDNTHLLCKIIM